MAGNVESDKPHGQVAKTGWDGGEDWDKVDTAESYNPKTKTVPAWRNNIPKSKEVEITSGEDWDQEVEAVESYNPKERIINTPILRNVQGTRPRVLQKLLYVLCECQFKMGQLNVNKYHNLNKCYTRIWVPINEGSTNMNRYHNWPKCDTRIECQLMKGQ